MKYTWLFFVVGAVLTWGAYVVTIDHGRKGIASNGMPPANAGMWAFLFIGLAYCVAAVVVPGIYLMTHKADPSKVGPFNMNGAMLSTVAGLLGAVGALCIVFAVGNARRASPQAALFVAPLVFSFAPIVNCLISLMWDRPETLPSPMFFLGLILAAGGAALVLIYKPAEAKHAAGPVKPTTQHAAMVK